MKNKININPLILEIEKEIIDNRRYFHKHPELSFKEYNTSKIIIEKLEEMKIPYQKDIAKTGITAIIKGQQEGKTIALRADMDALPIQETSEVSYKSINDGVMHACGHDGHIAMLLGAAKAINQIKHNLKGNVKLIFMLGLSI